MTTLRQQWRDLTRDSDDPVFDTETVAVVFALDRFMDASGRTHTGVRRLAAMARINKDTACDRIGRLVEAGWLKRECRGRGYATTYKVSDPVGQLHHPKVSDPTGISVRPGRTDPGRSRSGARWRAPATPCRDLPPGIVCDGSWHTDAAKPGVATPCPQRRSA